MITVVTVYSCVELFFFGIGSGLRVLNHDDCALSDALAQEERGVWQGGAWQHEWSLGWQATVISISGWPLCPDTPQGRGGEDRGPLGHR